MEILKREFNSFNGSVLFTPFNTALSLNLLVLLLGYYVLSISFFLENASTFLRIEAKTLHNITGYGTLRALLCSLCKLNTCPIDHNLTEKCQTKAVF